MVKNRIFSIETFSAENFCENLLWENIFFVNCIFFTKVFSELAEFAASEEHIVYVLYKIKLIVSK